MVVEKVHGIVEIKDRSLKKLDLAGALLSDWRLRDCQIQDCKFDLAHCEQWTLWACAIRDCSFDQANLRGSGLGTYPEGKHNQRERVSFIGADLRDAWAYGGIFIDCNFSKAGLKHAWFNRSRLSRCTFAGRVEEVLFEGRDLPGRPQPIEMASVDFSQARFVNVDFRGYRLKNVVLPLDPDVFLIRSFPCAGQRAMDLLSSDGSVVAQQVTRSSGKPAEGTWHAL